ncbi:MAG: SusC/RagA family TonB-linked outer membrane protein [Bacteroidales bacterium]|nr:SusC/RagA family TonB-linked outer membrane protein [Bacteroidales bacterium]
MKQIEQKSGFTFIYRDDAVDTSRRVSVFATDQDVLDILAKVFEGTSTVATIVNRNINLVKDESKEKAGGAKSRQTRQITVSGTVTDELGPVVGAVVHSGKANAITDLNGKYSISVSSDANIEFSCLGYALQNISVNGRSVIDVVMVEDAQMLQESVALGYGAQTKKKDLSAAVGVVDNVEKLSIRPVASASGMLQGQVAGVTVTADGGSPTSSPAVVIRGQGSRNGDSVLWVVDGIPGAPFSMNEVESIVVLKDAASAAIYGAQSGAGGVILVTTKRSARKGVTISYDGTYGLHQAYNLLTPLTAEEELEMRINSYERAGLTVPNAWNPDTNPWIATTRTNWMDEVFRTSPFQRHTAALNYNEENVKIRFSINYTDDQGVLLNTYSTKLSSRFLGEFKLNDYIKVTEDATWSTGKSHGADTGSQTEGVLISALNMPPSATVYNDDGTFGGTTTADPEYFRKYGSYFADAHGATINPVRHLIAESLDGESDRFFTNTSLEVGNIVKGLKFVSRFTYDISTNFSKSFNPRRLEVGKSNANNYLDYRTGKGYSWKTENTLTYDRTFGKHTVGLLAATTAGKDYSRSLNASGTNLASEEEHLRFLRYAGVVTASDSHSGFDSNVAVITRAAYSYDDRYFVTASWRRDYASRLPKQSNHGDFPAVTAAWKLSNESFFPKSDLLSLAKLRASWGRIGNLGSVPVNYKNADLNSDNELSWALPYGAEIADAAGNKVSFRSALNSRLTWETSEQIDLGLDLNMFRDRLSMSFDVYDKRTYNLIQGQTMNWTSSIGLNAMLVNQGEVRNRGFEATVGWNDRKGDFTYFVNANYSYNKNWVSDIGVIGANGDKGVWIEGTSYFRAIADFYRTEEGMPIRSYYLTECLGIFQNWDEIYSYTFDGELIQPNAQPGDLKFKDYNGDGKITLDDREYWGNCMPESTYAFTLGGSWRNLSASVMLQGVLGAQALYAGKYEIYNEGSTLTNKERRILTDSWVEGKTGATIPMYKRADANGNFSTPSTWYLEDTSYLRVKNVTLGYDFTSLLRKSDHFRSKNASMSVYLSGENLFTFTKYTGMDPEVNGFDAVKYPVSRIVSLGVKLNY